MSYETGRLTHADPSGVSTRDEFADFMQAVYQDYSQTGATEWTNPTLPQFLEGLTAFAWARLQDGTDQESPTWQLFAEIVAAATGYE